MLSSLKFLICFYIYTTSHLFLKLNIGMRGYVPRKTKHLTMSKTSLSHFLSLFKCQWTRYLSTMSGYWQWCSMQKIICTHIFINTTQNTPSKLAATNYVVWEVMCCCHKTKFHWLTKNIECCKQLWWMTYTVSKQIIMKYRWACCFTRQLIFPNKIFAIRWNKSDVKRWHQMKWHDVMTWCNVTFTISHSFMHCQYSQSFLPWKLRNIWRIFL